MKEGSNEHQRAGRTGIPQTRDVVDISGPRMALHQYDRRYLWGLAFF